MENDKGKKMFIRPESSYHIDYDKIELKNILNDEASPLLNIVNIIHDNAKVLDIGAGNGYLGWLIKKIKPGIIVACTYIQYLCIIMNNIYNI